MSDDAGVRCRVCGRSVLAAEKDAKTRIRGRIVLIDARGMSVACPCGNEVDILEAVASHDVVLAAATRLAARQAT